MVIFVCNTCLKKRKVSVLEGKASYLINNKRYIIKDENQDCAECEEKLRADDQKKREQIRQETIET